MLDGDGNPINKRNAWQTRSVLYVRLIPPGAADTAHFRVRIPKDAQRPHHIHGQAQLPQVLPLLQRVQLWAEGQAGPGSEARFHSLRQPRIRDGAGRESPSNSHHYAGQSGSEARAGQAGRGHRLDTRGAARRPRTLERLGHRHVTPGRSQGRRIRLPEGDGGQTRLRRWPAQRRSRADPGRRDRAAKQFIAKALQLKPDLGPRLFFQAMAQKADGDYDAALAPAARSPSSIRATASCRIRSAAFCSCKRDFKGSGLAALERVLSVDPEDIQAHYNLMLAATAGSAMPEERGARNRSSSSASRPMSPRRPSRPNSARLSRKTTTNGR